MQRKMIHTYGDSRLLPINPLISSPHPIRSITNEEGIATGKQVFQFRFISLLDGNKLMHAN